MRKFIFVTILLAISMMSFSQRFLLLEKAGTFKNIKYFEGDNITIVLHKDGRQIEGVVSRIADSTFVVDNQELIWVGEVKSVKRNRFFFSFFGSAAMMCGAAYFSLDVINRAINADSPILTGETAVLSGALVGSGWLLTLFKTKTVNVGEKQKWRLRVMTPDGNSF